MIVYSYPEIDYHILRYILYPILSIACYDYTDEKVIVVIHLELAIGSFLIYGIGYHSNGDMKNWEYG